MKKFDLLNDDINKMLIRYLITGMSGMLITSIYILADSIMIGNSVGGIGIGALNICIPIFNIFYGIGLLFGVGGGVLISIARGRDEEEKANSYFSASIIGAAVTGIIMTIVLALFLDNLLYLLGATAENFEYVKDYAVFIVYGGFLFLISQFFQNIIRNDHGPSIVMVAVISGGVLNIIIDYILMFPLDMGMTGAAAATLIGAGATFLILMTHFIRGKSELKINARKITFNNLNKVVHEGMSSFLIEILLGITVVIFNIQIHKYFGTDGLTVYGIILNCSIFGTALFNGAAYSTQPIIATNFGAERIDRVKEVFKKGLLVVSILGILFFLIEFIFYGELITAFVDNSKDIMGLGQNAMKLYAPSMIFVSINMFLASFFQATYEPKKAMFISSIRGFVLPCILLFVLPLIFGVNGIWIANPLSEFATMLTAGYIYKN